MIMELVQIGFFLAAILLLAKPLGLYMAQVYSGERNFLDPVCRPLERLIYKLPGLNVDQEMDWKTYAISLLLFSFAGFLLLYLILRLQAILPFNPQQLAEPGAYLSFNTAASFITNTNWQSYGGETTLSYFSQMAGLTVQNFLSAASGMAVLAALIRAITRNSASTIGNLWQDITRGVLYILLPLSLVLSLIFVSQGVIQTFDSYKSVQILQPYTGADGQIIDRQVIALGPAASQEAIKMLSTNGGGFMNVNSAHPFENPTPLTNFIEMLSILLIPAALCYTFGRMVKDTRQGWAILAAMTIIFVCVLAVSVWNEQSGNPALNNLGIDQSVSEIQSGGNMEGKEIRFGAAQSALWATATTAASNGSVNSMHDSFSPLGGLIPMWLMQMGEVIYGGVGSGLYGMLAFVIIAVFISGLMVGRTPEYIGKKIEAFEMKMASLIVLVPVLLVLAGTALAVIIPAGTSAIANPGPHGFSEILYAFSSASNNNGSAFAGLGANSTFYNIALAIVMLISRFWTAIPVLAIAGSLVGKRRLPPGSGTLPTHTPLFIFWLIGIVIIVGALSFFPALALGPVVEHLILNH
jgi:potassium-transporting ATPase potassium-binding subunit